MAMESDAQMEELQRSIQQMADSWGEATAAMAPQVARMSEAVQAFGVALLQEPVQVTIARLEDAFLHPGWRELFARMGESIGDDSLVVAYDAWLAERHPS